MPKPKPKGRRSAPPPPPPPPPPPATILIDVTSSPEPYCKGSGGNKTKRPPPSLLDLDLDGIEMFTPRQKSRLDDDCCILAADPLAADQVPTAAGNGDDDIAVVAERGKVACRDYPHPRSACAKYPFRTTPHEKYCEQCFCYVCDVPAPCSSWKGQGGHCHASDKDKSWKTKWKRNLHKGEMEKIEEGIDADSDDDCCEIDPCRVRQEGQLKVSDDVILVAAKGQGFSNALDIPDSDNNLHLLHEYAAGDRMDYPYEVDEDDKLDNGEDKYGADVLQVDEDGRCTEKVIPYRIPVKCETEDSDAIGEEDAYDLLPDINGFSHQLFPDERGVFDEEDDDDVVVDGRDDVLQTGFISSWFLRNHSCAFSMFFFIKCLLRGKRRM
ncbi:hypothetical protein E2562_034198 [Oryza meyeriana var. granulata]|uniref:Uncharacterized protein n=1 Tax=Oryza meyeriana var. granulata TaxID=110450 RepID=A0A6G1F1F1_9ORYZ|nr:hypothetical protein E2562_034198 [Oryza meyeriana var. granulata]